MSRPLYKQLLYETWKLREVIQSAILVAAQFTLLPIATLIDIHKSRFLWKNYKQEPNKHWGRKGALAIQILSTGGQIVALGALLAAFYGFPLLSVGMVSTIFIGSIALKSLPQVVRTIYHGIQWFFSKAGTRKNEKNKIEFKTHLKATLLITAACAGMMVMPAFPLITLSLGIVIAVKVTAVTLVGLIGLKSIYTIYKNHQQKKQRAQEWQDKYNQARVKRDEYRKLIERSHHNKVFNRSESTSILKTLTDEAGDYPDGPDEDDKPRAYFGPNLELCMKYQHRPPDFMEDDVDDLIHALEATDDVEGPKKTVLTFLRKTIDALLKKLAVEYDQDAKTHQLELNENKCLPEMKDKEFSLCRMIQKPQLRDRLHIVLLLECLVTKDKKSFLLIREREKSFPIYTTYDLMQYIKTKNKTQRIFQSFITDPKIKELFMVVDYYLTHKGLHPETRQSYEKTRRYKVRPLNYTCLAAPC